MRERIAAVVYYIVNIVLFPFTAIGYVIWVGLGVFKGRGSGVSGTAQGPFTTVDVHLC